jgi:hypothetical protein
MSSVGIGSISEGTLRTEDLIDCFSNELSALLLAGMSPTGAMAEGWRQSFETLVSEADKLSEFDSDYADEILFELQEALEAFAPPYCYFGAHEGDGADFGYWPALDSVRELPLVQDGDEARARGEDCYSVNDHGNITVYGGDGCVLWGCV